MNIPIKDECLTQIKEHMIPFWVSLRDTANGGYTGEHDGSAPVPHAPKGSIYHARILWFFGTSARASANVLPLEFPKAGLSFFAQFLKLPHSLPYIVQRYLFGGF
ncbi:hypothetical protein FACS1894147_13290 [Spirochaetia bacterium]|nr:hypothetical protein FACS1894147_13290 [Spirochaetia bacterium]